MISKRNLIAACCFSAACVEADSGELINAMKHDIQQVHALNFDTVLDTVKHLTVASVWYFKSSNKADREFLDTYNSLASQNKKMLKILAFDCDANAANQKHCARVGVESYPHVRLYPQFPQPNFEFTGEKSLKRMQKTLNKLMGSKVTSYPSDSATKLEDFKKAKNANPSKQKVYLFTSKKDVPVMLKGLSTDTVFARTGEYYFIPEADGANKDLAEAAGALKQKKLPVIMKITKGKTTWYGAKKDQPLDYLSIHEWINADSESGMGDKVKDNVSGVEEEAPEQEMERVKEVHSKTINDLCLRQKNICAIYLQDGKALAEKDIDKISGWESHFDNMANQASTQGRNAARFSWMWADVSLQKSLKEVLVKQEAQEADRQGRDPEDWTFPTIIMVKPPKRKRDEKMFSYLRLSGDATTENVKEMVEKVVSGSTWSKGDLPKWVVREKEPVVKKEKAGKQEL